MPTLYSNFRLQSNGPSFVQEAYGQDKSFTFTTSSLSIPASDIEEYQDALYAVYEEAPAGLVFMAYPTNNYEDTPIVFANKNAIVLPTEVDGTVEGLLDVIDFSNGSSSEPVQLDPDILL